MAWVRFVREGKCIEVVDGSSVLEAEIRAGLRPDAPCGGVLLYNKINIYLFGGVNMIGDCANCKSHICAGRGISCKK